MTRRWPELDGLRGVAIILVLVAHSQVIHAVVAGMVGVTLFFVLSGFLITYLLLEEKDRNRRIDLKAFYGRRVLRLLPALGVYLGGMALIASTYRLAVPIWDMTWPPALYISNYIQVFGHDLFLHRHTWSLAVEEHFYLFWPIMVSLGATRKLKVLAIAVAFLAAWRLGMGLMNPMWAYHSTDTNAYALGLGCLAAAGYHGGWKPKLPRRTAEGGVLALIVLGLVPVRDLDHVYKTGVWLPLVAAVASGICVIAVVQRGPAFLSGKTIRWLGVVSYSIYLWHAPLLQMPQFAANPLTRIAAVGLALVIAALSWHLLEGPISRSKWRRRLTPLPTPQLAADTS